MASLKQLEHIAPPIRATVARVFADLLAGLDGPLKVGATWFTQTLWCWQTPATRIQFAPGVDFTSVLKSFPGFSEPFDGLAVFEPGCVVLRTLKQFWVVSGDMRVSSPHEHIVGVSDDKGWIWRSS